MPAPPLAAPGGCVTAPRLSRENRKCQQLAQDDPESFEAECLIKIARQQISLHCPSMVPEIRRPAGAAPGGRRRNRMPPSGLCQGAAHRRLHTNAGHRIEVSRLMGRTLDGSRRPVKASHFAQAAAAARTRDSAVAVILQLLRRVDADVTLKCTPEPSGRVALTTSFLAARESLGEHGAEPRDLEHFFPVRPSFSGVSVGRNCSGRIPMPTGSTGGSARSSGLSPRAHRAAGGLSPPNRATSLSRTPFPRSR